jgi:DHA2 family multidrug resistance protein
MSESKSAPQPATGAPDPSSLPTRTKFLIFAIMAFGQFMALIDIQIVAASLNSVQAGLSAGPDEISWVQTGYLMAELVMIPFSGFLAQALSTRWLFALSAGLFTAASALCGMAWDINSMTAFRVLQGFVGGAMVPTVFATGYALFSGPQRAMIPAILGMVSVLAPTLGPTVGGWLTELMGWRSIFYINIVPGLAVTVLAIAVIRVDRPNLPMLGRIDYAHLASLAVSLGGAGICPGGGAAPRVVRRSVDPGRGLDLGCGLRPVPGAIAPLGRPDREADALPPPDLRHGLRLQSGHRLRPLRLDLSDPGVSGPRARL